MGEERIQGLDALVRGAQAFLIAHKKPVRDLEYVFTQKILFAGYGYTGVLRGKALSRYYKH